MSRTMKENHSTEVAFDGLTVLNSFNEISVILEQYSKAQHQELLDDIKNFRFQDITQEQSDNLKAYLTYLGETLGLDEVVAGMWDFLLCYDMPDYEAGEQCREQEHLVKMKKFGIMTPYFKEILNKLIPDFPFEVEYEE